MRNSIILIVFFLLLSGCTVGESINSKADLTEPEYDLVVVYEGELPSHAIYLWLGDENEESIMMYLTDEKTAYVTSTKATNQLRALLILE